MPTDRLRVQLSLLVERGILANSRDGYAVSDPLFLRIAEGNS